MEKGVFEEQERVQGRDGRLHPPEEVEAEASW